MERFLLVDDDEAFTQVLARALHRRGLETACAQNASQALELAQQETFSKAIIDLKMEGPSGLTLIPSLKEQQPAMDIVMLTGYSSVATAVEAVKLGAVNYLCKPANTDEILAAFANIEGDAAASIPEQRPSVDRLEWEHIQKVLAEQDGNISATARALGMHRRTLQRKLNKRPVKE
ncbi:two-component system response regulator [Oceanicoccus sagamiensis]|uniref:Two-component system response regulator n=2 Tax=Oceanicoccus sagamiensis TaxID=716816 RepID=A0A1X9NI93_9GAMM|nr:response regulator transcription factor [Oceanicoccus sagamiensis]ARN74617.1 two-component system response regulator [Oceanicoccus sagamiensis]